MKLDIKYVKSATMLAEELYGPEEYVEEECYSDEEDPYRDFEEPQDEMQYLEALVGETDEMKEVRVLSVYLFLDHKPICFGNC